MELITYLGIGAIAGFAAGLFGVGEWKILSTLKYKIDAQCFVVSKTKIEYGLE